MCGRPFETRLPCALRPKPGGADGQAMLIAGPEWLCRSPWVRWIRTLADVDGCRYRDRAPRTP